MALINGFEDVVDYINKQAEQIKELEEEKKRLTAQLKKVEEENKELEDECVDHVKKWAKLLHTKNKLKKELEGKWENPNETEDGEIHGF